MGSVLRDNKCIHLMAYNDGADFRNSNDCARVQSVCWNDYVAAAVVFFYYFVENVWREYSLFVCVCVSMAFCTDENEEKKEKKIKWNKRILCLFCVIQWSDYLLFTSDWMWARSELKSLKLDDKVGDCAQHSIYLLQIVNC